jgi:uncharacterized membrane protein
MNWLQRYRIRHYVRNAIWIAPVAAIVVAILLVRFLLLMESWTGWVGQTDPDAVRAVLGALAGAMFTFIVFVCSTLLLVVQLASAQLTPRVIGTMFRDRVTKFTLAVFVFTFTFVLAVLTRIDESVPAITTRVAIYGCAVSIGCFLYMVDHIGKMLRPSGVFALIAAQTHQVIKTVYPYHLSDPVETIVDPIEKEATAVRTVISRSGGVVLAFDKRGLVALGTRHDCLIEMVPQVGNFVAPGDPLFRVHGVAAGLADADLKQSIALGSERTLEQDPTFGFRVIVDVASKGLSPAINDPTTAVLAVDRIHHLLRHVGGRRLDNEKVRDTEGRVRLMYRTPEWEDFVVLAVTEIRQFGATSIQIARRLRAMLENLIETLPAQRAEPLTRQLTLLARSAARSFEEPEDRVLAEISDSQGVGGTEEPAPRQPGTN